MKLSYDECLQRVREYYSKEELSKQYHCPYGPKEAEVFHIDEWEQVGSQAETEVFSVWDLDSLLEMRGAQPSDDWRWEVLGEFEERLMLALQMEKEEREMEELKKRASSEE